MKKICFALLLSILLSCNPSSKEAAVLTDFIPENSDVVIKINDLESFKSDYQNNDFLSRIGSSQNFNNLKDKLEFLGDLNIRSAFLVCYSTSDDVLTPIIITKTHDSIFKSKSTDSLEIYSKVIDSFLVASTDKQLVETIKRSEDKTHEFKLTDQHKSLSIHIKSSAASKLSEILFGGSAVNALGEVQAQLSLSPNQILINGIVKGADSSNLQAIFKGNKPQLNTIQQVTPNNAKSLISLTFSDVDLLHTNLNNINAATADTLSTNSIFYTSLEIGQIILDKDSLIVLKSIDATTTKDALLYYQDVVSNFRNEAIYEISRHDLFAHQFQPFIGLDSIAYYTILDDFFVFGQSETTLEQVISSYKNGNTIANDYTFEENMANLSDESSLLIVANSQTMSSMINALLSEDLDSSKFNDYGLSTFQLVQDDGFAHLNAVIQKAKPRTSRREITELFTVQLDAEILGSPQFVTNHRTRLKDIVAQDINNQLYLISNSGKILWRKQLHGNILGDIEQVDLYRNGRLQLAFATPKRVYIIDRNGKDVTPFPLKFNDQITQPLSVFDYNNDKNYRFLITQGEELLMYDKNANLVNGFNYKSNGQITTQPKHFRVNSKDYIVFGANSKMQILNRRGHTRINVNATINFSGNQIYLYRNAFSTTTSNGELIQVTTNGQVNRLSLNLGNDHYIDATSKTLASLWENNLNIKSNNYELEFGEYTAPRIFYINDKIYVATTDLQEQKIYLFDSQAKLISNFPVYGTSPIDLDNIDKDRNLEFVTKGEINTILLYKMN